MLATDESIDVAAAADRLAVSASTIRRDLDRLADQQLLSRTHGGAVPNRGGYDGPVSSRSRRSGAEALIAERAVSAVEPASSVALNGGAITLEIARRLGRDPATYRGTTVVTNAVSIAVELMVRSELKLVVSGGVTRPPGDRLVGPLARQSLGQLSPDLCLLEVTGVDVQAGVTCGDEEEASVNQVLTQRAKETRALVPGSAVGEAAFARICSIVELSAIITDESASAEAVATLRAAGIEVIIVGNTVDPGEIRA